MLSGFENPGKVVLVCTVNLTLSFSLKASDISTCSVSSPMTEGEMTDDDDSDVAPPFCTSCCESVVKGMVVVGVVRSKSSMMFWGADVVSVSLLLISSVDVGGGSYIWCYKYI